jgi:hypothetical protein
MQPYSDYEIAQRRIHERQNKKSQFRASIVFLVIPLFITFISSDAGTCTLPLAVLAGLFVIGNGIELYYSLPEHAPIQAEVEQEMEWLLGDYWQDQANAQAYAFAYDRIRKRRISRWRFVGHLLLFVPINGLIVMTAATQKRYTDAGILLLVAFVWLVIFINHARSTFPSKRTLAKREINFGKTLHFELARLQPEKAKAKEKLKRGKYYQVGDDGELEEVEEVLLEENSKRGMRDDG